MRVFGICLWAGLVTACGPVSQQESELNRSEVPASHRDFAILGQAYHSDQRRILNVNCVQGEIVETLGNTEAEFELALDLGFSEIVDRLGGKLGVGVSFPVVRAGASASYGQEMGATELVNNYHFSWRMTPKKRVLLPGSLELSSLGEQILANHPGDLHRRCGDEVVTAIEYGASLNVNLRMEFRNEQDKREIGGKIKVSVGKGIDIISVEGDLDYLNQEVKKSVKITVQATQRGGDPLQLLSIIPSNLIACTLDDPTPCFQVFTEAVSYARERLADQFVDLDSYNVIKYHTESYDESAMFKLVPSSGYPSVDILVEHARRQLDEKFQDALLDHSRASKLRSSYREWLSEEQYQAILGIERGARLNAQLYSQAAIFCYDNPYDGCLETIQRIQSELFEYDRAHLSIEAESVANVFRCEYTRHLAVELGEVSARFAIGYRQRSWAPIFYDSARPEIGVKAWGDCYEALKTYGDHFHARN